MCWQSMLLLHVSNSMWSAECAELASTVIEHVIGILLLFSITNYISCCEVNYNYKLLSLKTCNHYVVITFHSKNKGVIFTPNWSEIATAPFVRVTVTPCKSLLLIEWSSFRFQEWPWFLKQACTYTYTAHTHIQIDINRYILRYKYGVLDTHAHSYLKEWLKLLQGESST